MKKPISAIFVILLLSLSFCALAFVKPVNSVGDHDIAVTQVFADYKVAWRGCPTQINMTVANLGLYDETFNLTLFADQFMQNNPFVLKEIDNIHLTSNTSKVFTVAWDGHSANLLDANDFNVPQFPLLPLYGLEAVATEVANETDTTNNSCVGPLITLTMPGDVDGNLGVTVLDLIQVANKLGQTKPFGYGYPIPYRVDANNDDKVNVLDLITVAHHLGDIIILP